jgi:hypothetical protein
MRPQRQSEFFKNNFQHFSRIKRRLRSPAKMEIYKLKSADGLIKDIRRFYILVERLITRPL